MKTKFYLLFVMFCYLLLTQSTAVVQATTYPNKEDAITEETKHLEGKPGVYLVRLSYQQDGKVVEESIYVTVAGEDTVVKKNIAINANPIAVAKEQIPDLTNQDWIALAEAKAWNTETGEVISITSVDASEVQAEVGVYSVTFFTVNQLKTTVQVEVMLNQFSKSQLQVFQQNKTTELFEEAYSDTQISWANFEEGILIVMQYLAMFSLLVPIIALILIFLFTRKLVKQVVKLVVK